MGFILTKNREQELQLYFQEKEFLQNVLLPVWEIVSCRRSDDAV
jgi:hypothetical protein